MVEVKLPCLSDLGKFHRDPHIAEVRYKIVMQKQNSYRLCTELFEMLYESKTCELTTCDWNYILHIAEFTGLDERGALMLNRYFDSSVDPSGANFQAAYCLLNTKFSFSTQIIKKKIMHFIFSYPESLDEIRLIPSSWFGIILRLLACELDIKLEYSGVTIVNPMCEIKKHISVDEFLRYT